MSGPVRDASSPVAFSAHPGSSITSASFTPPNNSLLTFKISVNDGSAPAMTVSNTGTGVGAWSLVGSKSSGAFSGANSSLYIYEAQVSTGSAITVSASFGGFSDIDGFVEVWTSANSSQAGAATTNGAPTGFPVTPVNPTVVTTAANSEVIGVSVCDDSSAGMTSTDSGSGLQATNIADFSAYKAATTATSGTSVAINFGSAGNPSNLLYVLLEILALASAPTVTAQPSNQACAVGATATFSVSATASAGSLTYQWYRNGSSIGSATASSYTTPGQSSGNNADQFYCAVTDSNGTVNTRTVRLFISGLDTGKAITDRLPGWFRQRRGADLRPHSFQLLGFGLIAPKDSTQAGKVIWRNWAGLSSGAALAVAASSLTSAVGALTTAIKLTLAASSAVSAAGALTTGIPLGGAGISGSSASGAVTTAIQMGAAATALTVTVGALTTSIQLLGVALSASSAVAGVTTNIRLGGDAISSTVATGSLSAGAALVATMTSLVAIVAGLTTGIRLTGTVATLTSAVAALTTAIKLGADAVSDDTLVGLPTTRIMLDGHAQSVITAAATIAAVLLLTSNAVSDSFGTGGELFIPPSSQPPVIGPVVPPPPVLNTSSSGGYIVSIPAALEVKLAPYKYVLPEVA